MIKIICCGWSTKVVQKQNEMFEISYYCLKGYFYIIIKYILYIEIGLA